MGSGCPLSGRRVCSCSLGRPDGSGMAAERSERLKWSGGRPVAAFAHHAASMGSGLPAERSEGLQLHWVAPWRSLLNRSPPWCQY